MHRTCIILDDMKEEKFYSTDELQQRKGTEKSLIKGVWGKKNNFAKLSVLLMSYIDLVDIKECKMQKSNFQVSN